LARGLKILLVSNGFFPEISPRSYRATELTKEFLRQGHQVVMISKYRDYDYSDFMRDYPITLRMWNKPIFNEIPEFKQHWLSVISRIASRFLSLLFEYPGIEEMYKVKRMLKNESEYDLLISFAVPYPVQWGVAWARTKEHQIAKTWIADCGDPYMGDVLDTFRHPFYFRYLEKWFCRKADFISIPIESAKAGYYPEFYGKIRVIPQGFNFDIPEKAEVKHKNDVPEFAYAGRFLKGIRDPVPLLQILVKIDLPFKFYVFTDQADLLSNYIEILDGKLIISGFIAWPQLMKKLSEMDFLINFDNHTQLNVPSKLIDYAITNKPVLNIDKSFQIQNILAFLQGDYTNRMKLPEVKNYHISNVTRQFLSLLND
jgi:hypothetical protein